MWFNYKIDETEIIKKNVRPDDTEFSIELNIFYKIQNLKNIIIKNNPLEPTSKFNIVYQHNYNKGQCNSQA